ncbi:MAG TPA: threonine synthase [Gemmatimonadaceae bacterium]
MTATRVDAPARWQQCAACGHRLDELDPRTSCPECGGLLDVMFHVPPGRGADFRRQFTARVSLTGSPYDVSGVWRYAELIMSVPPGAVVSFPEGNTPLLSNERVSSWAGCQRLQLKHEGMNPTGSFKDRGMTVGVTQARRVRASAVACASTGNTSASLAAYAALAGLPALVLVPSGQVAAGKLHQTLAYGARTLAVRGDFDACLALLRDAAQRLGVYLLNSVNPYRIEGQKSIVFEMLQQLDWKAPDWIALPAGNLGNTAAFGKALDEAARLGLIDRLPRLLAVQAAGAAPFYQSFVSGFHERHSTRAETIASAIRIGDPASYDRGVRAIQLTQGVVVSVPDAWILEAQRYIGGAGIGCEPASAASVAGVRASLDSGLIGPDESVVAVLTGHLLKDPFIADTSDVIRGLGQDRNEPIEVDASLGAIEREVASLARN